MTYTAAALAAIIRDGTETDIGIAYRDLIERAGHDAADEIWADAHRQVDTDLHWPPPDIHTPKGTCPGCRRPYALRVDGRIRNHETDGWDSPPCPGGGEKPGPA